MRVAVPLKWREAPLRDQIAMMLSIRDRLAIAEELSLYEAELAMDVLFDRAQIVSDILVGFEKK